MRIEPAVIKQLLQLQLQQGISSLPDTGSGFGTADAGNDFASLLETLLDGSGQASGGRIIPASELLARTSSPITPWSLADFSGMEDADVSSDPSAYEAYIQTSSARHGVDPSLVKAVIHTESDFNSKAVSPAGAKGLMQLMDGTGEGLGVRDPFDPQQNIEGGTRFLSGLLKKYGGEEGVALAAYNAGPGRVDRLGIRTDSDLKEKLHLLPRETQKYVTKVLGLKEQYSA